MIFLAWCILQYLFCNHYRHVYIKVLHVNYYSSLARNPICFFRKKCDGAIISVAVEPAGANHFRATVVTHVEWWLIMIRSQGRCGKRLQSAQWTVLNFGYSCCNRLTTRNLQFAITRIASGAKVDLTMKCSQFSLCVSN
uniref:Uncharacterized protein n=1 Tax=Oryza brachyantha TaxID=4533 RepID=J3LEW9_ORYBR